MQISKLQNAVAKLQKEQKAVHQFTAQQAKTISLAQLKNDASSISGELQGLEGGRESGDGGMGGERDALLSVDSLARDVRQMNRKVDSLSDDLQ